MTDYWSKQERCIVDGFSIGFVTASGTIGEGNMLKFSQSGTTTLAIKPRYDGQIIMEATTGRANALAVAMKAAGTGETFPVLFYGIHKLEIGGAASETGHAICAGSLVVNSSSASVIISAQKAGTSGTLAAGLMTASYFTGLSHILGTAVQAGLGGDEILVLVGRAL